MEYICQHCDTLTSGARYQVLSEEDGVVFLNMIVCRPCHEQAKDLGLHAVRLDHESRARRSRFRQESALAAGHM